MDIIFSANNNEEIMVFPVVPPDTGPAVPQEHEDFEAITGKMKIIGNMGLRSLSIESFWPVDKNYPWVRPGSEPNGWLYVEFFEKWREKKVPIRVIITTDDGATRLNMACVVNDLTWKVDRVGDIKYKLDVEEYRFAG